MKERKKERKKERNTGRKKEKRKKKVRYREREITKGQCGEMGGGFFSQFEEESFHCQFWPVASVAPKGKKQRGGIWGKDKT